MSEFHYYVNNQFNYYSGSAFKCKLFTLECTLLINKVKNAQRQMQTNRCRYFPGRGVESCAHAFLNFRGGGSSSSSKQLAAEASGGVTTSTMKSFRRFVFKSVFVDDV